MATKVFVENQYLQNLAKYKDDVHGEQNRIMFMMRTLIFFLKEA